MKIHYLEVVTPDVDSAVALYSNIHSVTFDAEPKAELGNARIATLSSTDGGYATTLGIRAPMHDAEKPVVRPYVLVDDIEAAAKKASEINGVVIAVPPMPIEGRGKCAIYIKDGIEYGLWEL